MGARDQEPGRRVPLGGGVALPPFLRAAGAEAPRRGGGHGSGGPAGDGMLAGVGMGSRRTRASAAVDYGGMDESGEEEDD